MSLPLLSYDQLLTANFFDFRQIVLCKLPKHIGRYVIVSMTKNIADPCYFWPRNFGSSLLFVVREMTTRFGNDFQFRAQPASAFPNSVRKLQESRHPIRDECVRSLQ